MLVSILYSHLKFVSAPLYLLKVCKKKPISFEVFGDTFHEMFRQAIIINSWGKNVYVKIPVVNSKGLFSGKVINVLSKKGIKLNITAVYTVSQVRKIIKNINKNSSLNKLQSKDFDDFIIYLVIGIILGGSMGYVLIYNLSYYLKNFHEIFYIWNGGMSFNRGWIGVIFATIIAVSYTHLTLPTKA